MSNNIADEVDAFAKSYAALFSSPDCSTSEGAPRIAAEVAKRYRPGVTFFTNGSISRFGTQNEAARLIASEMHSNIVSGMGTHLEVLSISKIEVYSDSSALCWLDWAFHPKAGSECAGKDWKFTNIYSYRAASEGQDAGWEFVVRDQEVNVMVEATGKSFLD